MSRKINLIVVHCSDSDIASHDNIETIRKWHVEERGFSDVGYHYFIKKNGEIQKGRDEGEIGAHCSGHNKNSIGICLSGRHEFTKEQFDSLEFICLDLTNRYSIDKTDIVGHNDLNSSKTCPNFDIHGLIAKWCWH